MFKKLCHSCGITKDSSEFYKDKTRKDRLQLSCKECCCIKAKKYREEHQEQEKVRHRRYREEHKNESAKYRHEHQKRIAEQKRRYRQEYPEEIAKQRKRSYKKYQQQIAVRGKRYREEHQEQILERKRKYLQTPNGKAVHRRNCQNYRARKKNLEATLTAEQWDCILKTQNNRCNMCGKKFTAKRQPTQDHIIPMMHNGSYTSDNIQALCKSCNSSKNAKLKMQYIQTWTHL